MMEGINGINHRRVAADTELLGGHIPVPGFGILPVNSYLIRATQPVLVDTGLSHQREGFMAALRASLDISRLRWVWLTHADPDHMGNLASVLAEAPEARVVTTFIGMGKLMMHGLPAERMHLLNPGQRLDVGDRQLLAVQPPVFDAPETLGLYDPRSLTLFSSDCFGTLLPGPADSTEELTAKSLRQGLHTWSAIDSPWLRLYDADRLNARLGELAQLGAETVLGSHLPPAPGMLGELVQLLAAAMTAPPVPSPDQAALEAMLA
ncbi:MBL fold metallo-hydrolase [Zobellella sp. DQSA1]|uniref:MBL fold metallo-hydrolase n=1 Tax=Zobellella sp. DQSA1 TaxID=3342386 RepID=UPI0035C01699